MVKAREWSDEEKQWIIDNLSYVPETGDLVWKECASSTNNVTRAVGTVAGTLSPDGYINISYNILGKRYFYRAHRIIWFLNYGEVPSILDHINGNKSDNRIENLRPTTQALNLRNRKPKQGLASKYKGVYLQKGGGKCYFSQVRVKYKLHYIGRSKCEKEVAEMYDKWIEENLSPLEREYAKTNKELGLL